jgi:hypothetical protein
MDNEQLQKMLAKLESDIGSDPLSRPLARKAQTDVLNEAFDEVLKGRQEQGPHRLDFIGKNVAAITDDPRNKGKPKKEKVDYGEVYVYSGQKFQYTEMQKELLRQKLSDDHKNHYTYGKDYLSLSMAMVNEEQLAHTAKIETQSKFLDARGFVYPAVRAGKECNEHPKKLPEATVEVPPRISARTHPPTHPPTPAPALWRRRSLLALAAELAAVRTSPCPVPCHARSFRYSYRLRAHTHA